MVRQLGQIKRAKGVKGKLEWGRGVKGDKRGGGGMVHELWWKMFELLRILNF